MNINRSLTLVSIHGCFWNLLLIWLITDFCNAKHKIFKELHAGHFRWPYLHNALFTCTLDKSEHHKTNVKHCFFCWFLRTFVLCVHYSSYIFLGCLVLFWKFWPKMGRRTPELKRLRTATVESREDSMSKPSEPFECCDHFAWCQECPVSFTYLLWFSIGIYYTATYKIQ